MALRTMGVAGPRNIVTRAAGIANIDAGLAIAQGATDGQVVLVTAAGQQAIGISAEPSIAVGDPLPIVRHGDVIAICGAVIAAGVYVKANAAGQLVPIAGAAGGGEQVIGRAESSTIEAGDQFVVFVNPFVL